MKAETVPIGEKMIAQEANLEREFAGKTITEASLTAAMQAIAPRKRHSEPLTSSIISRPPSCWRRRRSSVMPSCVAIRAARRPMHQHGGHTLMQPS